MKACIITQEDPFYLAESIDYFLKNLPDDTEIVACVLLSVSPFGKNESFWKKAKRTFNTFGGVFFIHYTIRFILNNLNKNKKVDKVLKKFSIPIIKLKKSINAKDSLEEINKFDPELLISIGGNQIFRRPLLNLAPKGCLNLHTALLPKYRGLMPSFWVLKNNESETGVSVFFVDEGIDSGPIIVQKRIRIGKMNQEQLIKRSKKIGMDAIIESIRKIQRGDIKLIKNPDNEMSYYSFPTKEDVRQFRAIGKSFF
jgi:methionyl-tRNA formyltransferase